MSPVTPGLHLKSIAIEMRDGADRKRYPFGLPLIQAQPRLAFASPITIFVGENGSGKSTLLEAIACATELPTAGEIETNRDPTLAAARDLAGHMRLAWSKKTRRGLFLRAEDFFGFAKRMAQLRVDLENERRTLDESLKNSSPYARALGRGVLSGQIGELQARYGDGIDTRSHGEGFLEFFRQRFVPNGLYLLDEPEAPLSPQRQLTLIALIKHMLSERAQFIIATHSPLLMALPGATIFEFRDGAIAPVAFDDTEHVRITRSFLQNPEQFLRRL